MGIKFEAYISQDGFRCTEEHYMEMVKYIQQLELLMVDIKNNAPTEEPDRRNVDLPRWYSQLWAFWVAGQKAKAIIEKD